MTYLPILIMKEFPLINIIKYLENKVSSYVFQY